MTTRIYLNSFLVISVLVLNGCASYPPNMLKPNWMPRGYVGNDDTPISSPNKTTPWFDSAVINDTDKISAETVAWQGAIFELLDKSRSFMRHKGLPLMVIPGQAYDKYYTTFDHYLRQGLMKKGYTLTTTEEIAPLLIFSISKSNEDGAYTLTLTKKSPDGKKILGNTSITAILP